MSSMLKITIIMLKSCLVVYRSSTKFVEVLLCNVLNKFITNQKFFTAP